MSIINPYATHNGVNAATGDLPLDRYCGERQLTPEQAAADPAPPQGPQRPRRQQRHQLKEKLVSDSIDEDFEDPSVDEEDEELDEPGDADLEEEQPMAGRTGRGGAQGPRQSGQPRQKYGRGNPVPPEKLKSIADAVKAGKTCREAAEVFDVSAATVTKACRQHGVTPARGVARVAPARQSRQPAQEAQRTPNVQRRTSNVEGQPKLATSAEQPAQLADSAAILHTAAILANRLVEAIRDGDGSRTDRIMSALGVLQELRELRQPA